MNYEEARAYLSNMGKFGENKGLHRTKCILKHLGDPHNKIKTIHIAGTNGKGSTTAMIANVLIKAGFKVGMYTSPYLEEFEERIQINNKNIPKEKFAAVMTEVERAILLAKDEGFDAPTEFEVITCAMFKYFYEEKIDYGVIEVGLGGRLDSTNVIKPLVSVITSISFDHMAILGDTLEKITKEKSGIIKRGIPIVTFNQKEEIIKVIKSIVEEKDSSLIMADEKYRFIDTQWEGKLYQKVKIIIKGDEKLLKLPLLGNHQIVNCSIALKAIEVLEKVQNLNIPMDVKIQGIETVRWPGRLEVLGMTPLVVIDGAHNGDGIKKLKDSIETYFKYNNMILILGILTDKDIDIMINTICPIADKIIAVTPHSERGEVGELLKEKIMPINTKVEVSYNYKDALETALKYTEQNDLIVVAGSLYMIGDMRSIIINKMKDLEEA